MVIVCVGYLSGIIHKAVYSLDWIVALYCLNMALVAVDLALYLKFSRANVVCAVPPSTEGSVESAVTYLSAYSASDKRPRGPSFYYPRQTAIYYRFGLAETDHALSLPEGSVLAPDQRAPSGSQAKGHDQTVRSTEESAPWSR